MKSIQDNLRRWSWAVAPNGATIIASLFWQKLQPDWQSTKPTSPWAINETKPDWSVYDLKAALESIGLKFYSGGGSCPVQVEALLPDYTEIYFRARGQGWYCERTMSGTQNLLNESEGNYGQELYAAGYMPLSVVFELINKSLQEWDLLEGLIHAA